jgi:hypothetical protein
MGGQASLGAWGEISLGPTVVAEVVSGGASDARARPSRKGWRTAAGGVTRSGTGMGTSGRPWAGGCWSGPSPSSSRRRSRRGSRARSTWRPPAGWTSRSVGRSSRPPGAIRWLPMPRATPWRPCGPSGPGSARGASRRSGTDGGGGVGRTEPLGHGGAAGVAATQDGRSGPAGVPGSTPFPPRRRGRPRVGRSGPVRRGPGPRGPFSAPLHGSRAA